ncbi:MAG: FAD-dependent oxidoreductase [Armatimonadetes bacterium]|nr:FAD-dependent oxidoreductase [Armatimonadota bacterium]
MKVAVVGAGISGLYAARRVEASGAEVRVFEATDRLGGRIQTVHRDGLVYEAAAEWILPEHQRALTLARSLGLPPIESPTGPNTLFYKGETNSGASLWEDAALDDQRLKQELDSLLETLDNPKVTAFQVGRLDTLSLQILIKSKALSERGAWWLESKLRAEMREDPGRISVYGYLVQAKRDRARAASTTAFRIPGGMSELVAKLAASLKSPVQTGKRLVNTEWKENQVFLTFADGTSENFDQAVLAMPPKALLQVAITPSISPKKRAAWEAAVYGRAVKVCLEFSRDWWTEIGWNGRLMTNRPIQRTWDGTLGSGVQGLGSGPDKAAVSDMSDRSDKADKSDQTNTGSSAPPTATDRPSVLNVWICGKAAESWARFSDPVRGCLEDLAGHFPQAKEHFTGGTWTAWLADSPSGGAYMFPSTGFVLAHSENLITPEGRLHFAGDFWGESAGRIEGALDSAERVSTEVSLS